MIKLDELLEKPECWNWQTGTVQNRVSLGRESSNLSSGTLHCAQCKLESEWWNW